MTTSIIIDDGKESDNPQSLNLCRSGDKWFIMFSCRGYDETLGSGSTIPEACMNALGHIDYCCDGNKKKLNFYIRPIIDLYVKNKNKTITEQQCLEKLNPSKIPF